VDAHLAADSAEPATSRARRAGSRSRSSRHRGPAGAARQRHRRAAGRLAGRLTSRSDDRAARTDDPGSTSCCSAHQDEAAAFGRGVVDATVGVLRGTAVHDAAARRLIAGWHLPVVSKTRSTAGVDLPELERALR